MKTKSANKLWGAAFSQEPSTAVIAFTAGRDVVSVPPADGALLQYDLWVNKVHCQMLAKQHIIPQKDATKILHGLKHLEKLVKEGTFILDPTLEDVHTNIENWLTLKLGIDVAGKLHTARSRNDQIMTDMKLYLRDQALMFTAQILDLASGIVTMAHKHTATIMPGFTHHQHAMVTTWGHVLASFASMLVRDAQRFMGWYSLHNASPLGNSVGYGTTFPVDSHFTADLLGFDGPEVNSLDSITNRWEAEADVAWSIVTLMNHLSLIAQTLILLTTPEFGMVTLSDTYSTGSSIMPQKKNPDPLEVIKAKAAYSAGLTSAIVSMGKANFFGYNRDSQWTKYLIMDIVRECISAPVVLKGVLETMTVHKDVMKKHCNTGYLGATSLMEQLVFTYKIPMRKAKTILEKAVHNSIDEGEVTPHALLQALVDENIKITIQEADIINWQKPESIHMSTHSWGGPGQKEVTKSLTILTKHIVTIKKWIKDKQAKEEKAFKKGSI